MWAGGSGRRHALVAVRALVRADVGFRVGRQLLAAALTTNFHLQRHASETPRANAKKHFVPYRPLIRTPQGSNRQPTVRAQFRFNHPDHREGRWTVAGRDVIVLIKSSFVPEPGWCLIPPAGAGGIRG